MATLPTSRATNRGFLSLSLPKGIAFPRGKATASSSGQTEFESASPAVFNEGGYGWVVVLSVFLVNMHTWGVNSAYAVFLAYYLSHDTFQGASSLTFAFIGGLSISIAMLVSPAATALIRHIGTGHTMRIGVIFETASFIGASFSYKTWHLILSQGIAFGIGMGLLFNASIGVISQWFTHRRALANALGAGGSGMGGLVYALGTDAMISHVGLAWAFRILAILVFAVNGLCSFTLRDRNKAVGAVHVTFHGPLLRRFAFWLFVGWGFFFIFGYVIAVFSISAYGEQVGFSASRSSLAAAMFNLSQGVGRPIIGLISDRFGRINVAGISTLLASLAAFFLWIFAGKYYGGLIVYSMFGVFSGVFWCTAAAVGAEVVGIQLLPAALSITWLSLVLPATFAEAIGLSLRKDGGISAYIDVQVFTGAVFFASFVSIWILRSWKLREIEQLGLTGELREAEIRDDDTVAHGLAEKPGAGTNSYGSIVNAYVRGFFTVDKV